MKKSPLFIFDFDGTVVDSEPNYDRVKVLQAQEWGVDPSRLPNMTGIGTQDGMIMQKKLFNLNQSVEELVKQADQLYLELARANTPVFPKVKSFIEQLYKKGYPMVIASGTSLALLHELLAQTAMASYFKGVFSAEQVALGKPDPTLFLYAAKQMGYKAADCVVLEDSKPGLQAAQNAKMPCIALPNEEQFEDSFFHSYPVLTFNTGYNFDGELVVKKLGLEL